MSAVTIADLRRSAGRWWQPVTNAGIALAYRHLILSCHLISWPSTRGQSCMLGLRFDQHCNLPHELAIDATRVTCRLARVRMWDFAPMPGPGPVCLGGGPPSTTRTRESFEHVIVRASIRRASTHGQNGCAAQKR